MALKDGFPSASGAADANDIRLGLAGLVVRDTSGNPRTGIFPRHGNALVTSTPTMNSAVAAFEACLSRSGQGAIFLANDGTVNVLHEAAPVANKRYDIIYVKQNDAVSPNADANSLPVFGILKGDPAPTPPLPTWASAKAALDAAPGVLPGAEPLAAVEIPSTATSMQSSGVVYTQLYQYTATSGGVVPFRTKAELDLWLTAPKGQRAHVLATGNEYVSDGAGGWPAAGGGVVLLSSQSFTSVAAVSVNDLSGYDRYEFVLDVTATSTALNLSMRLRSGGADNSAAQYDAQKFAKSVGVATPSGVEAQSSWAALSVGARASHVYEGTIQGLSSARQTWLDLKAKAADAAAFFGTMEWEGRHRAASAFDGFSFFTSAGTMTGTLRVYGYSNG